MICFRMLSLAAGLLLVNSLAIAGNNASGTAELSWDEADAHYDIHPNLGQHLEFYLRLQNVPDVRELAVALNWTPVDTMAGGFAIVSASPAGSCGWAVREPEPRSFLGDSTYEWRIAFSPGDDRTCVRYVVATPAIDPLPSATFTLASVAVLDGGGNVDTLGVTGPAITVSGGSHVIRDVYPSVIARDGERSITIRGAGFSGTTLASLVSDRGTLSARSLEVQGDSAIVADFLFPQGTGGAYDLTLMAADDPAMTLPSAVIVVPATTQSTLPGIIQGTHLFATRFRCEQVGTSTIAADINGDNYVDLVAIGDHSIAVSLNDHLGHFYPQSIRLRSRSVPHSQ